MAAIFAPVGTLVPVTGIPTISLAVVSVPVSVTRAEPFEVTGAEVVVEAMFPMVVVPEGRALLPLSRSTPPETVRSPVNVEELFPPRVNIPSPIFAIALTAPAPDWVMFPSSCTVLPDWAAEREPVLNTTPLASVMGPAKPNQPLASEVNAPLVTFNVVFAPIVKEPVTTAPKTVPFMSMVSLPVGNE